MDYGAKALKKLETLKLLLKDQKKELQEAQKNALNKIREIQDPEVKKQMNDFNNSLRRAMAAKDSEAVKSIIQEIKQYSVNLNNADQR